MDYDYAKLPAGCAETIELPCGATAAFDYPSGIGYRCMNCMAIWGSVGSKCYQEYKLVDMIKSGKGPTAL
jgi:hypothetical protein